MMNVVLLQVALSMYGPALEKLSILRMLQQTSQVYTSMKMSHLQKMIPFLSFDEVEKLVVDAVKFNYLQIKIDYQNQCVHFGSQILESEKIRNHLTVLAKRLNRAVALVHEDAGVRVEKPKASTQDILAGIEKEHRRVLARKVLIERRKEEQERMLQEQEREEENRKRIQQKLNEEQEKKRQVQPRIASSLCGTALARRTVGRALVTNTFGSQYQVILSVESRTKFLNIQEPEDGQVA